MGSLWSHFGASYESFWEHFAVSWVQFRDHSGVPLWARCGHFGRSLWALQPLWGHFQVTVGSSEGHVRSLRKSRFPCARQQRPSPTLHTELKPKNSKKRSRPGDEAMANPGSPLSFLCVRRGGRVARGGGGWVGWGMQGVEGKVHDWRPGCKLGLPSRATLFGSFVKKRRSKLAQMSRLRRCAFFVDQSLRSSSEPNCSWEIMISPKERSSSRTALSKTLAFFGSFQSFGSWKVGLLLRLRPVPG